MQTDRSHRRRLAALITALCWLLVPAWAAAQGGPVQYGYDELGRLVVVSDGAGNTAIYNYDAVGNLLSIQRIDPGQLGAVAIIAITPTQGRVGSMVSIFGKGFGVTPGQNTVSFNGGVAAVTSASPTALRVTVPANAVDGPISVTAPAGSATSAQSFHLIGPLTVMPAAPTMSTGASLQFAATSLGGSTPPVGWAVNGIPGGNAAVGTISTSGLYTSPAYVNTQTLATVTATEPSDPTATGSTAVTIMPKRLASAGQGVSVAFAPATVANSVQRSVSVAVGGTAVVKSLQTSVSLVVGGEPSLIASAAPVSITAGPVITGASPAAGARGASGLTVTLTGAGFTDATQVTFFRNNVADTTITNSLVSVAPDGTQATLSVSIASGAVTGARVIQITTPTGASTVVGTGANVFTVQ